MSVLFEIKEGLFVNPAYISDVVTHGKGGGVDVFVVRSHSDYAITLSADDWHAVKPLLVARYAARPEIDEEQRRASLIAQAVSEIIAEEQAEPPATVQWVQVNEVQRDTFYSKTSRGHRAMWRLFTTDGRQVNVFDHADPLRDQKHLLQQSDYLTGFQAMEDGQFDHWTTSPIEIDIVPDGSFWKLVQINPRAHEAFPDAPVIADETEPETSHRMFSGGFYSEIDLKEQIWDAKRAAGHYDDVLGPVNQTDTSVIDENEN